MQVDLDTLPRIVAAGDRLGLWLSDPFVLDGVPSQVEHVAHEVGHALSLGLPLCKGMARAIDETLQRRPPEARAANEALVLAAEAIVLPRLGLVDAARSAAGEPFFADMDEVVSALADAAVYQEIEVELFESYIDTPETNALADQITVALLNMAQSAGD